MKKPIMRLSLGSCAVLLAVLMGACSLTPGADDIAALQARIAELEQLTKYNSDTKDLEVTYEPPQPASLEGRSGSLPARLVQPPANASAPDDSAARAYSADPAQGTLLEGHETVHLYPGDRVRWFCSNCPDGSVLEIQNLRKVDLEKAVDVALYLMQRMDGMTDAPDCSALRQNFEEIQAVVGTSKDYYLGEGPVQLSKARGPAFEGVVSDPIAKALVGDKHHLMKFTWVLFEGEDAKKPLATLDPHIHVHENPPGG